VHCSDALFSEIIAPGMIEFQLMLRPEKCLLHNDIRLT